MPTSNSFGAGAVNSKNIHSPSTYNSESVTLNQSLPQKPSLSPQQEGGSNLSAAAQSQTNTRGAMGGQTQSASNSNRKITPQLNAPAMPSQPTQQQQFQPEPIGPQPSHEPSQKQQKQAQQLAAFLKQIPKPSTSATPQPRAPSPLSPTQNGQHKSGLSSTQPTNTSASLQSRQNNISNRPMPSQGSCDIPDNNNAFSRMPMNNERLNSAPAYNVTNKAAVQAPPRGRSPAQQQQTFQSFGGGGAFNPMKGNTVGSGNVGMAEATGGYNFNRIMDDHFEHYKRPASRERSVDKSNLPNALSEAPSRVLNRPASRARTPSVSSGATGLRKSLSKTDINLEKRLEVRDDTKTNLSENSKY